MNIGAARFPANTREISVMRMLSGKSIISIHSG